MPSEPYAAPCDGVPLLKGQARRELLERLLMRPASPGESDAAVRREAMPSWRLRPSGGDPLQADRASGVGWPWLHRWAGALGRGCLVQAPAAGGLLSDLLAALQPHSSRRLKPSDIARVTISKGQCAGIFIGADLHAKVSTFKPSMEDEFHRQRAAWLRWPQAVPRPLAFGCTGSGLAWLLSQALHGTPCRASDLVGHDGRTHPALWRLLGQDGPVGIMTPAAPVPGVSSIEPEIPNAALPTRLMRWAADAAEAPPPTGTDVTVQAAAQESLRWQQMARSLSDPRLSACSAELPHQSQHGDLWMGNMAWRLRGLAPVTRWMSARHRRDLIVYDWEDHGRLALPGLDLHLLECCGLRLEASVWPHATAGCIEPGMVPLLRPLYEAARLWLRRGYAPAARGQGGA